MKVGNLFKRMIAKSRLDNLYVDLNEQDLSVVEQLRNEQITQPIALHYYKIMHDYGVDEYNQISKEFNLNELGLEKDKRVQLFCDYIQVKMSRLNKHLTM